MPFFGREVPERYAVRLRHFRPFVSVFPGSTRDLPCFVPGAAHVPVFSEKPPQIMPVNDEIIDPEFIPEIKIFLFDFMEFHLKFGGAVVR